MKLGVDLGGTKIECIVLNEEGEALWRKREATPQGHYLETIEVIARLTNEAKQAFQLAPNYPLGIGTPGALFYDQQKACFVLRNSNSTALNGKPFLDDLKRRLSSEVYLENDANCFALAEALSGCGKGLMPRPGTVFGVILGTGVGGGIVIDKRLLRGRHHIAGEWGHNKLAASALGALTEQERNRPCYCGRIDCVETYLSGPGLADSFHRRFGINVSSRDIIHMMRAGDVCAKLIWNAYLDQLAASLAQVVNILDPDLIVLGGGLSLIEEIYTELPQKMAPHVFTENFTTPVISAKLGDSAGVYGAAWLA